MAPVCLTHCDHHGVFTYSYDRQGSGQRDQSYYSSQTWQEKLTVMKVGARHLAQIATGCLIMVRKT